MSLAVAGVRWSLRMREMSQRVLGGLGLRVRGYAISAKLGTLAFAVFVLTSCGASGPGYHVAFVDVGPPEGGHGSSCAIDADCDHGTCDRTVPGGYCTAPCADDAACGRGVCYDGFCMQRCVAQRECRSSAFDCFGLPGREYGVCGLDVAAVTPPSANIGASCTATIECAGPAALTALCLPEVSAQGNRTAFVGGMCTAIGCTDDASCGAGGSCVAQGDHRVCALSCGDGVACRDGYLCHPSLAVCLPPA